MELGLTGKTVIVTGGSSNIGRSISLAFGQEGCNVVIADIDQSQAERVNKDIEMQGSSSLVVKTDVTDWGQVQAMTKKTIDHFGAIDILVNNVGWSPFGFFVESTPERWDKIIKLNFWSTICCTKAVLTHMIERKQGDIINIGSPSSQGMKTQAMYGACKAAVESFSYALAREVGRWGIRVNVVNPPTPVEPVSPEHRGKDSMHYPGGEAAESWKGVPEEEREPIKRSAHPLREIVTPDDVAAMVVLMASAPARTFTAQTVGTMRGVEFR